MDSHAFAFLLLLLLLSFLSFSAVELKLYQSRVTLPLSVLCVLSLSLGQSFDFTTQLRR